MLFSTWAIYFWLIARDFPFQKEPKENNLMVLNPISWPVYGTDSCYLNRLRQFFEFKILESFIYSAIYLHPHTKIEQ